MGPWEPDKIPKCCLGDPAMADEHYIVMTVECQRCKTKRKVHVAARTGFAQMGSQTIPCISCNKHFRVTVPATRVRRHWFGRRVDSHVVISAQSRPRVQPLLELQSDAKAVVIEPLAIDHLSENRRSFFHGSDLHLYTRLPNAPGKHAGAVRTDVIGVGPFFFVGRQIVHPR